MFLLGIQQEKGNYCQAICLMLYKMQLVSWVKFSSRNAWWICYWVLEKWAQPHNSAFLETFSQDSRFSPELVCNLEKASLNLVRSSIFCYYRDREAVQHLYKFRYCAREFCEYSRVIFCHQRFYTSFVRLGSSSESWKERKLLDQRTMMTKCWISNP